MKKLLVVVDMQVDPRGLPLGVGTPPYEMSRCLREDKKKGGVSPPFMLCTSKDRNPF